MNLDEDAAKDSKAAEDKKENTEQNISDQSDLKTEAALLPRDSSWMLACWHIAGHHKDEIAKKLGENFFQIGRLALRVHDLTSKNVFDVAVLPEAETWFVNVPEGGHEYFCEVGYKYNDSFEILAKTNSIKLPPSNLTGLIGEKIQTVSGKVEKLIKAGADKAGMDSENLAKRWEMFRAAFAPNIDERAAEIAEGKKEKEKAEKAKRKNPLWLVADCELVIFGATEKDASITIGGRKVRVSPDGTFNARFAFPDGVSNFQIKAETADKTETKTISIEANRKTVR